MKKEKTTTTTVIDLGQAINGLGHHFLLCGIFGYSKPQVKFNNPTDFALAVFEGSLPCPCPFNNEALDVIHEALSMLTDREVNVLQRRCGLGEYAQPQTLQEIADGLGLTKGRVRAIEARAYQKLRHPGRSEKLRDIPVLWVHVFDCIAKLESELRRVEAQFDEFAKKIRDAMTGEAASTLPLSEEFKSRTTLNTLLAKPISDFELTVRAANSLEYAGIKTLGDLASKTEAEMLRIRNFGRRSLIECKEILSRVGLSFASPIPD